MCRVILFGEDEAHEIVLRTLVERLGNEAGLRIQTQPRSVRGGHAKMLQELAEKM